MIDQEACSLCSHAWKRGDCFGHWRSVLPMAALVSVAKAFLLGWRSYGSAWLTPLYILGLMSRLSFIPKPIFLSKQQIFYVKIQVQFN